MAVQPTSLAETGNVNSAVASPSPEVHQAETVPSSGSLNEAKKIVVANHPTPANDAPKKSEKAAKNNEKLRANPANAPEIPIPSPDVAEKYPNLKNVPGVPDITVPDMSRAGKRGFRRFGGTTVRNLPDGTQVMTLPDGTRVVTLPNGTKRVLAPGQKIQRRRALP